MSQKKDECAWEEKVHNLWDGELSPASHGAVIQHIAICELCQASIEMLGALASLAIADATMAQARKERRMQTWA